MIGDFGTASIKMVGSLIIILGVILCLFYLLKRIRPSAFPIGKNPMMRIVGRLNLAPKRSLALVEVCGQWLVLGIGAESVTLLSKMDRMDSAGELYEESTSEDKGFHRLFKQKALKAMAAKNDSESI